MTSVPVFAVFVAAVLLLLAAAPAPQIKIVNDAGIPDAELRAIVTDFESWAAKLYGYYGVTPKPVTLELTREVPFGFYSDGTVRLPPNDRQAMLEDWVHELTHHALGRESSFFFREGAATHAVEALFAREKMTPRGWPYFGQGCDAWTRLFDERRAWVPLAEALTWTSYQRGKDFESWQLYLTGCSFIGWTVAQRGMPAFRQLFDAGRPQGDLAAIEREWLKAVRAANPARFDPATALPQSERYRNYLKRLAEKQI